MVVKLKANGAEIKLSAKAWDLFSEDQKLRYDVLDKTDSNDAKSEQVVSNETKVGESKDGKK